MHRTAVRFRRGITCGVVLLAAAAAAEPRLRERVVGADYDKQAAEVLGRPLPDPAEPAEGVAVYFLERGSPGRDTGLQMGDVICAVDGQPVTGPHRFDQLRAAARGPQAVDVWVRGKPGRHTVTVPPGDLGMELSDRWVPQVQYLRSLPAGAKPVDELRVAALSAASHGPLAETALARARKAGASGPDVDLLAAITAWCECRPDDALAFATAAAPGLTDARRRSADRVTYRSALATFRWAQAARVAAADPDCLLPADRRERPDADRPDADRFPAAADADLPADVRVADPVGAFEALAPVDHGNRVTDAAVPDPVRAEDVAENKELVKDLRQSNGWLIDEAGDHYARCVFGPPGADVDLGVGVKFHHKDDLYSLWPKGVTVALVSADHPGADADPAVSLTLGVDGGPSTVFGQGIPICVLSLGQLPPAKNGTTHVRVTAVGGWCRIAVDRKTVWYGPLSAHLPEAGRRLCGVVQDCSVKGEWTGVRWRTAGPAK